MDLSKYSVKDPYSKTFSGVFSEDLGILPIEETTLSVEGRNPMMINGIPLDDHIEMVVRKTIQKNER